MSTGQKRTILKEREKKGSTNPQVSGAHPSRAVLAKLQSAWVEARKRKPELPPLAMTTEARQRAWALTETHGAGVVLRVGLEALRAAERGEIPGVYWSRIFTGRGFEARFDALGRVEVESKRQAELRRKAFRPPTQIELRILGLAGTVAS